jgi:arylsulfatase
MLTMVIISAPFAVGRAADRAKPNVIIVMTDDQGLGDFSFTGNPVLKTPNFDEFAAGAVRFTDFHVCPMCSPTRGQLLTGLTALRNGATSVTAGRTFLRPGIPTLADVFGKAGYTTGLFGKWHLGDSYPHRPIDKGFQENVYHLGWGQLLSAPEFDWPLVDGRYFHNGVEKRYKGHCTDFWFDSAMAWMKDRHRAGEAFLCYLPTNAPHAPYIDLKEYATPYAGQGPAEFFGMIAHVDQRFGDLEKFLVDEKLKDDTIVIFMTDNGGTAGVNVFNAGLRGHKTQYYEGGHRVPCWIRWPNGRFGPPRDIDTAVQNVDLLPTLCELCGVASPSRAAGDDLYRGESLVGLLRETQDDLPDRKLVVQYGQVLKKFESCVIWGTWRLVMGEELYDVQRDRGQTHDVANENPEVVKHLRDHYESWWRGLQPMIDEFVPISIGARRQPVVELTCGDWEGIYADNSAYVREAVGGPKGGHWNIRVEEAGRYRFTLRRWPKRTRVALGDEYEPSATSPAGKQDLVTRSFPTISAATVEIAGVQASIKADPTATDATLAATIPAGRTRLKAWFSDAVGNDLCGAFFVTVAKQEQ